ncbi:helicase-exonuclease AddAB subunit AddA [Bacillus sp. D12]|uniref:helicase-exonuclease AddAB subunit AddA n=2 Tax=Bacillales TaxID=1385 RepID=UPI000AF6A88C|nr:helicase-exonuclease AddAB subunit AddA [Bacillus sp. D12]
MMNNRKQIPVKPADALWTDDQWKAITADGNDILVAAAAGSGKTAVLVERIIRKIISEDNPLDVDRLLIATFTNASAAEMRHRIAEALEKEIKKNPDSRHLRKQLSLLNKANISTLHSFCLDVVRSHYYLLDIDPGFRIGDSTEIELIKDEILEEVLETQYGISDNEPFFRLIDAFTDDRSDRTILEIIRVLDDFSRSNPNPKEWLESLADMYEIGEHTRIEDLPFYPVLKFDIMMRLAAAKEMIHEGYQLTLLPDGPAALGETFKLDEELINKLSESLEADWQSMADAFSAVSFAKAKTIRKGTCDEDLAKQAKKMRDDVKKLLNGITSDLFFRKADSFLKDISDMKPYVVTLAGLVTAFQKRFLAEKLERGIVDFSDLEHMALEILGTYEYGTLKPTDVALEYRDKFKEVLVDEYQDTNMVQETILQLVTQDGESTGNMFMVGDVKQSIYRFRLAEPNLFMGKYSRFLTEPTDTGMKIDLNKNFRSRSEVLAGTNFLFKQLMGKTVGEIEYDEPAELKKGAAYPEDEEYPVELYLIDKSAEGAGYGSEDDDEADEDLETVLLEARQMAELIKQMINERRKVYDAKTKTYRNITYRDIVILLRSMPWAPQIMDEFRAQGIPVYADLSTGYFEATEVAIMISLLQIIDNPYQDIPLASVLRSPIVGLDEENLSDIRITLPKGQFYDALKAYCQYGSFEKYGTVYLKVKRFFDYLHEWRNQAREGALSSLIWQLYRDTGYYDFVGGMPGGKQRQANLLALYNRARQYEESSFRGIFRFLRFIDRMRERGSDLGAARALGEQEDVVRIMTIHKSKGLEFPVVILGGLSKKFNQMDLKRSYLVDKDLGLAFRYVNPELRITYPSLPQIAFKKKQLLENIAEEMRVLYVALTRAKEKLYLIGTLSDAEKSFKKWSAYENKEGWLLPDYTRANATSYMDWIGPSLVRHRIFKEGAIASDSLAEIASHPSEWQVHVRKSNTLQSVTEEENMESKRLFKSIEQMEPIEVESEFKERVRDQMEWDYRFKSSTTGRSKQSVSELKRLNESKDEYSATDLVRATFKRMNLKRPAFMQQKTMSPAEKGTMMHLVMQHLDFTKPVTEESVQTLLGYLVMKEYATKEQVSEIRTDQILSFFESELGQRLQQANKIRKEIPFTMALPAHEAYQDWQDGDENILVQGIVDCLFEDENGLVLLDYKTDAITDRFKNGFEEAEPVLKERYEKQIQLYTRAIEQILKREVSERYLMFFDGTHVLKL